MVTPRPTSGDGFPQISCPVRASRNSAPLGWLGRLVDVEDFQARSVRVDVGEMDGVAVPQTGVIERLSIMIETHRSIDDLVFAVVVDVAHAQIMIALSFISPGIRAGCELSKLHTGVNWPSLQFQAASRVIV